MPLKIFLLGSPTSLTYIPDFSFSLGWLQF